MILNELSVNIRKILYAAAACIFLTLLMIASGAGADTAGADQLFPEIGIQYGEEPSGRSRLTVPAGLVPDEPLYEYEGETVEDDIEFLSDDLYLSTAVFGKGTEITLNADEAIDSIYILWEFEPGTWTLRAGEYEYTCGQDQFLHEFVEIPKEAKGVKSVTLVFDNEEEWVSEIYVFSKGKLPDFVQKWEPSYETADILCISTHADDEELFFGGLIPTYTDREDVQLQIAYFCDFEKTEPYRNHEILNGLWAMGVTHYPQLGEFEDFYSEDLETAQTQYDHDECLEYIVRTIRRFKPQVVIGQDPINGEYGHGGHILCAQLVMEAVDITNDKNEFRDSYKQYGGWDVPKTYFHIYPEAQIELDARVPLAGFGGKTALEVARKAYENHLSQQDWWFYVDDGYDENGQPDGYEYSCTLFGLYRTQVGNDTGNDILENIVTYTAQGQEIDEEEASRKAEEQARLEEESRKAAEAESIAEAERQAAIEREARLLLPGHRNFNKYISVVIVLVLLILITICQLIMSNINYKVRKASAGKKARNRRRKRK